MEEDARQQRMALSKTESEKRLLQEKLTAMEKVNVFNHTAQSNTLHSAL